MAEDPRQPDATDSEGSSGDEPRRDDEPDVRGKTAEDMLEEDRFESTDN
jgi:hypothetical protein